MMKSMCKHMQMQAISLALGIEALTACASIGWEHGRDGRGVNNVRACDGKRQKRPHGESRLLAPGVMKLTWRNSMNYNSEPASGK